ncbi:hypothetical protein [Pasteurella multocida]|uniref:phage head morphogenesis protein n=1 Tax=Pasteurella multocida TaxID=747 RepID=UPI001F07F6F7|nr:hypothetical protein [Pasteurella multocida]
MSKFTFQEQSRYFEKKLNLKTNSYLDIVGEEHDYFFVVAGANRNEVINAFREAVDQAIHHGETLESFRQRFDEIVEKQVGIITAEEIGEHVLFTTQMFIAHITEGAYNNI